MVSWKTRTFLRHSKLLSSSVDIQQNGQIFSTLHYTINSLLPLSASVCVINAFLEWLKCHQDYFVCSVDASEEDGTLGRLVNDDHISPNCEMKKVVCEGKPHLCLFALKKIFAGEEITYNYGDSSYPWRSTVGASYAMCL